MGSGRQSTLLPLLLWSLQFHPLLELGMGSRFLDPLHIGSTPGMEDLLYQTPLHHMFSFHPHVVAGKDDFLTSRWPSILSLVVIIAQAPPS